MLAVLLSSLLLAAGPEVQIQLLDGSSAAGVIVQLDSGQLVLETSAGKQTYPAAELLNLAPKTSPEAGQPKTSTQLSLVDGSTLPVGDFTVTGDQAQFKFGRDALSLSKRAVALVRFKESTPAIAKQWEEILALKPAGDLIVIRKGESIDYLEGVLGDAGGEQVQFTLEGRKVPVGRERVEGLVYFQPQPFKPGKDPLCVISLADGASLSAASLELADSTLKLGTPAGLEVQLPWDQVTGLDYSQGKVQYLGDDRPGPGRLTAESIEVTPYLGPPEAVRADLLAWLHPREDGWGKDGPLKLDGKVYSKGLAVRSRTQLVYRLRGEFSRLVGVVGIDQQQIKDARVPGAGHVQLVIQGDGRTLYEGPVSWQDEQPLELELGVANVSRMTVLVDYGEGIDRSDFVDLCEMRVIK